MDKEITFDLQMLAGETVTTETPPASGAGPESVTPSMSADDIKKLIDESVSTATAQVEERYKKELSSRDKAYTILKKEKDDLEIAGLSDKDKAAKLLQKEKEEKEAKERELQDREVAIWKLENVSSLKLPEGITPAELTEFIHGKTAEEVKESTNRIYALIAKIQASGAAKVIDGVDNTPGKANGKELNALTTLEAQLKTARENKNLALQLSLKAQIEALKKKQK